jgi:CubicO group peptidase (beta-lactamase class C family)
MATFRRLTIVISSLIAMPCLGMAQVPNLERSVDQVFAAYDKANSPGCALGVVRDGQIIYKRGYGLASLELNVPITPASVFYIGSMSKQFTAASVVLAAEQGFLSLDDNVRTYVPELPDYGQPITLRQMLHHMSGFSDVLLMLRITGRNAEDLHPTAELINLIARQKTLNFKPGEEYMYSNTNYFLLAEVVRRATKKPLSEFASENIFKPLGMTHTRFYDDHTVVVPARAAAYRPGKNGNFLVDWSTNYDMVGGGGLMSSVDDLLLWDENFYSNKLGKGTLINEMQTRGVLNGSQPTNYGLGLFVDTYRGLSIVDHPGALLGYQSNILRFPQKHFTVMTLCNVSSADPASLTRKVADLYLAKDLQPALASVATSDKDAASFAGKYFDSRRHFLISFSVEDGHLVLEGETLQRIDANRFVGPLTGGTLTFSKTNGVPAVCVVYMSTTTFDGAKINDLALGAGALMAYTGIYKNTELNTTYTLSVKDGSLTLQMNWNPPITLRPAVADQFVIGEMTLVFRRDSAKRVSGVDVFAGWNNVVRNVSFKRIGDIGR